MLLKFNSLVFFFLLFITGLNVFGQYHEEKKSFFNLATIENHLELSAGLITPYLKDEAISPLVHKGEGIQGNLNYFLINQVFCASAEVYANYSLLGNKFESIESNPMMSIFIDINVQGGAKVYEKSKTRLYVGAKINYITNQWIKNTYSNSAYQYNTSLVTGPFLYVERPVFFKGEIREVNGVSYKYPPNMKVSLNVYAPFLGIYVKPMYHGFADISNPDADFVSTDSTVHTTSIFRNMLMLESKLNVDYMLKNGNSIRLSYWWKFHKLKEEDYNYQYALQGISLAFLFRFDKLVPKIEPLKK